MNQRYKITVQGQLTAKWESTFEGMQIACLEDGNTQITSSSFDQSELYGFLMRLRDLGMTLIAVNPASTNHCVNTSSTCERK